MKATSASNAANHIPKPPTPDAGAPLVGNAQSDLYYLLMQAPVAIVIFRGPNYIIELANDLYLPIAGRTRDELLHKPAFEAMPVAAAQGFIELLDTIRATGEPFKLHEHETLIDRNGHIETTFLNIVYQPIREADGAVERIMILITEVTEQVQSRKKVEDGEELLRIALEGGGLGTYDFYPQTGKLVWSSKTKELFGLPPDAEVSYDSYLQGLHPDDKEQANATVQNAMQPGHGAQYESEYRTVGITDGKLRWVRSKGKIIFDDAGRAIRLTGVVQEITERKQTEEKIKQSEQRFRGAVAAVQGVLWTNNANGEMEGEQPGWAALTGQTYNEYQGYGWAAAVHPDDAQATIEAWNRAVLERQTFVFAHRLRLKNGTWRWFSIRAVPLLNADGAIREWVGLHTDITEQRKAEESLQESEERFRTLAESLPQLVWMVNENGEQDYASSKWKEYTGIEPTGFDTWKEMVHPDDIVMITRDWQESLSSGRLYRSEARLKNKFGAYRWHFVQGEPMRDDDGKIVKWIGAFTDIHDQKTLSEKLEKLVAERTRELLDVNLILERKNIELANAQTFLQQLIDSSIEFISVLNNELNYVATNKRFEQGMGLSRDYLKGKNVFDINPKAKGTIQHESILKAIEGKTVVYLDKRTAVAQPDFFVDTYFIPWIIQEKVEGVIIMARDVTEIVKTERLLEEKNRELERSNDDLQQFAHVASHDLKEPVRKIRTFTDRLTHEFGDVLPERANAYLEKIEAAASRMYQMIDGVLDYSGVSTSEQAIVAVDLTETIRHIESDLEVVIYKKNAVIKYNDLPVIEGSPVLIHQLFYNLMNNALKFAKADVPPVVHLSATTISGSVAAQEWGLSRAMDYAQVLIQDNGIGFSQEQAERIFKTFTRLNARDKYEGTGLGLALCKKIVERHHGAISAVGMEAMGAIFKIILPLQQPHR